MALLDEPDPGRAAQLFCEADRTRKHFMGEEVHIRGIIEFSNDCRKDCLYCGLRKSNDQLFRYRMSLQGIFEAAREARRLDFQSVVLQSPTGDPQCPYIKNSKCVADYGANEG